MENASKALLMAGGMLMTMIIIGMFLLMYNNLTVFFSEDSQANREAQIVKFNEAYESYNRDDENNLVRGTEMLSLLAKVQHYNIYKSDSEGILVGYKPMTINIKNINLDNIKYDNHDVITSIKEEYTQTRIEDTIKDAYRDITNVKSSYKKTGDYRKGAKEILEDNVGKYNYNKKTNQYTTTEITDSNLETLASSLALIESTKNLLDNTRISSYDVTQISQLQKTLALMQNIFNPNFNSQGKHFFELKIAEDNSNGIKGLRDYLTSKYDNIMKASKQYYQYQQFKKSYFKCTGTKYDNNTGRIIELDFEYVKTGD